jgi:hypothetical protein
MSSTKAVEQEKYQGSPLPCLPLLLPPCSDAVFSATGSDVVAAAAAAMAAIFSRFAFSTTSFKELRFPATEEDVVVEMALELDGVSSSPEWSPSERCQK